MNREPRDELRMSDAELAASVATFCDEADDARFEAQAALLDSPDIVSGARPVDTCDECASVNVGPCPHGASAWPPGGLPHGEHPYDYGYDEATVYVYAWGNNTRRSALKGRACVIEATGAMGTALIRFLDNGERVTTSRRALRTASHSQTAPVVIEGRCVHGVLASDACAECGEVPEASHSQPEPRP